MSAFLLFGICCFASAAVVPRQNLPADQTSKDAFSVPNNQTYSARSAGLAQIQQNFQYGPDIIGEPGGAFWPTGSYADEMINYDKTAFFDEGLPWINVSTTEALAAVLLVETLGGLHTLQDYDKLYDSFKITVPDGPYPGILSNGDQDLLFSMERLSAAPFGVRRLDPSTSLPFTIDDSVAQNVTTLTLSGLLSQGRLFYVDHRDQGSFPTTEGRYAAATDAYFYISPTSQDFLPLAIRMNRGSDLIYTPADTATDWLFAKMAFNMNNLWFDQWYHLETTHYLTDIVFMAAVRTLDQNHPVYGMLDRLSYQTFAIRLAAVVTLLQDGGPIDQFFFSSADSVVPYASSLYTNGAGDWLNTEFTTNLQQRGLINCTYGPDLKDFPYFEDASVINSAIDAFITSYVDSFYSSDADVQADPELAAFVAEANGPAKVINFPSQINSRSDLVALLRHYAVTASVVHGVLNANEPVHTTATLPYHPMAFYQPLPTEKGLADIVPLMPNVTQAAGQVALLAAFNRPFISEWNLIGTERTLYHMFDLDSFLARTNDATKQANEDFKTKMADFSKVVQARGFDEHGLSQGMPFVWKVLDPLNVPFYVTV